MVGKCTGVAVDRTHENALVSFRSLQGPTLKSQKPTHHLLGMEGGDFRYKNVVFGPTAQTLLPRFYQVVLNCRSALFVRQQDSALCAASYDSDASQVLIWTLSNGTLNFLLVATS